ncbi:MAG TPA: response regulator transcription factor [Spirochaetia bacterium]|nr:response regulator transcription factor [Spirochaetia bacterium]
MRPADDPVILLITNDRALGEKTRFHFGESGLPARVEVMYGDTEDGQDVIGSIDIHQGPGDILVLPVRWIYRLFENVDIEGTPIIAYGSPSFISEAFVLGCCDYLREPWEPDELWIRASRQIFDAKIGYPWGTLNVLRDRVVGPNGEKPLSYPEYRIMAMLARHRGAVVTRQALYYALWGRDATDSRVVDMHVSHLRRKLHEVVPPGNGELIETIHGQGYCLF